MSTQPSTVTAPANDLPQVLKTGFNPNGSSPNGSEHPSPSPRPATRRGSRLRAVILAGLVLGVAGAGVTAYVFSLGPKGPRPDLITHVVKYEPVRLTVVERGALESADNREVFCRVRAGSKTSTDLRIRWVIDDGAHGKQGDRLLEIEDSALQDQLKTQKIVVDAARAASVAAEQTYSIVRSQNESLIANAQIAVELAKLDLKKYQ